jgi:uncharacterized peroxidase-related enzyme
MNENMARAFAEHPEILAAWQQLNGGLKQRMDLRRYELATLAAALRLRSSYCSLAHGSVLAQEFDGPDVVQAIVADRHAAGLDETDVAIMDFAEQVAADATQVTEADRDRLRSLGLSDAEIFDVVLAAAARSFLTKSLEAMGVRPDASYAELEPGLRDALTVGLPIATA